MSRLNRGTPSSWDDSLKMHPVGSRNSKKGAGWKRVLVAKIAHGLPGGFSRLLVVCTNGERVVVKGDRD